MKIRFALEHHASILFQEVVQGMMAISAPARSLYLVEVCINPVQLLALGLQLTQRIGCQLPRPLRRLHSEAVLEQVLRTSQMRVVS